MNSERSGVVFLCGFPSSGTDLLKNVMNAHREIHIGGEFPRLPALARRYSAMVPEVSGAQAVRDIVASDVYGNLGFTELQQKITWPARFEDLYVSLLCPQAVRWTGNKTPQNSENVDRLNTLFPEARYVLIVRDVRDVALSWRSKWGKDPVLCAERWNVRMLQASRLLQEHASGRYLLVTYERLIDDPASVAHGICEFLGLEFDERMGRYHEFVTDKVAGKLNYGEPVIAANKEKWREQLPRRDVQRVEEIAWLAMRSFGYQPIHAKQERPISRLERVRGVLRDSWSLVTVGNRASQGRSLCDIARALWHEIAKRTGRFKTTRRGV
jgi:hypothetical protein